MEFKIISGFDRPDDIRALFSEYTQMLVDGDALFAEYLKIQKYDDELEHLEKKYAPPGGRLFIALDGETAAGCVALRQIDARECEMKRLYVRPEYRGTGLGGRLARLIIDEAGKALYERMLLDTLPFLDTAIGMYRRLGFVEIPRYNDSPLDTTIFLGLDL